MTAFRVVASSVAVFLAVANLGAQGKARPWIQGLLPPEARVIEMADLNTGKGNAPGNARGLVLWMLHPNRVLRQGDPSCSDWVYGDHWYGPTRLSLIDLPKRRLVNTVEIRGPYEGSDEAEHGFPIPFHVSNEFYHIPRIDKNKEGAPRILNLRDLTGEGAVGQFVLFEYEVCGTALTSVLGYSRKADAAVSYLVELSELGAKTEIVSWVPHLFSETPVRPGYWNFTWEPGHGADCWIHEEVQFDPIRQIFLDTRQVKPYPATVRPRPMGKKER